MKKTTIYSSIFCVVSAALIITGCGSAPTENTTKTDTSVDIISDSYTLSVEPVNMKNNMPGLQAFVWATQGNKILIIGGRTEGFHGLSENDTLFKSRASNSSVWVINMDDFSYKSLALDMKNPKWLQFASSNMQFSQTGDTLVLVGGYGIKNPGDIQSNFTYNQLVSISVSAMINAVEKGIDPSKAILNQVTSPYLQVTGGEMGKFGDRYYIMMGQNYDGVYKMGKTGNYTQAIRSFKLANGKIYDTISYTSAKLHRRDYTMAPITQKNGNFFAMLGGVFTPGANGYTTPIYMHPQGKLMQVEYDTLNQITSQYQCAHASIYNASTNTNTTFLFGGIGQNQYNKQTKKWENGDHGIKLPFVTSITRLDYSNGKMKQHVQLPPDEPECPLYMGANADFFPIPSLVYQDHTIDLGKVKGNNTVIGYIFGGIISMAPSSNDNYPTSANKVLYKVILNRK